jgi:hypothetical protein
MKEVKMVKVVKVVKMVKVYVERVRVVKVNVEVGCESGNGKVKVVRSKMVNKKVVKVKVP